MEKKGTKITAPDTPIVQTVMQTASATGNIHQNSNQYPKCICVFSFSSLRLRRAVGYAPGGFFQIASSTVTSGHAASKVILSKQATIRKVQAP
jgi:hypothetical protein